MEVYEDADLDGYGDGSQAARECVPYPSGWVEADGDCAPLDAGIHPGAEEVCNGVDDDCNQWILSLIHI